MKKINAIAFDADDTLWENEPYFKAIEPEQFLMIGNSLSSDIYPC